MSVPTDRLSVKIAGWLQARAIARKAGDFNLARSISADLRRYGYSEEAETSLAPAPPEAPIVLPRRRGRPPKIRPMEEA